MNTAEIACFVANISYEEIPREAVVAAKNCILDGLGVALAGSADRTAKIISSYVKDLGGRPEAGVIGGKFLTCAHEAALANGVMVHVLDYDDSIKGWGGHLTAVILPAVLALSEREKTSGKAALEAFVAGWEAGAKIGAVIGQKLMRSGWHPHAVVGPLAAAAACSRILKLDEEQTRIAFGIAVCEAAGLQSNYGTGVKPFHAGKGARSAVVAALLAQKGLTANQTILEGPLGLARIFTQEEWDPDKSIKQLGDPYSIVSPGVTMKLYPSCGLTQRSVSAILHLIKEHHLVADDVAEVECETHPSIPATLRFFRPQTGTEGKFSMQYCMATALLEGKVTLGQFTDDKVSVARVRELMEKVKYRHPEVDRAQGKDRGPQTVTVTLKNGRRYTQEVLHARGEPEDPLTQEEVASKFRDCAQLAVPQQDVERIIELVSNLDSLNDITELMKIVIT